MSDKNQHVNNAIQIVCRNPQCEQPLAAERRIDYFTNSITYECNVCIKLLHGPIENEWMCRDCGKMSGWDTCDCPIKTDFMYGGPIVICEICHKQAVWIDGGHVTGFAGGQVYFERLSCGHMEVDESNDIAAAF